jgi:hypothetical protein
MREKMTQAVDYKNEIIERTNDLIEEFYNSVCKKGLEVTFLVNCLLGLIVAAVENNNSKSIFTGNIGKKFGTKIPEKVRYLAPPKRNQRKRSNKEFPKLIHEIKWKVKDKTDLMKGYGKHKFISHIRNGIAHQNMTAINENKQWQGIRMWNEHDGLVDFEIEFTNNELKEFALYIADEFKKGMKKIINNSK